LKKFMRLLPQDNVGVALVRIPTGATLRLEDGSLLPCQEVPAGHKLALVDLPEKALVIKYGQVIGETTRPVQRGEHVHLHNLRSLPRERQ
jgi:urease beta subunit